jgi:hypothetical protein
MDIILPYIADRFLDKQENDDNEMRMVIMTICLLIMISGYMPVYINQ